MRYICRHLLAFIGCLTFVITSISLWSLSDRRLHVPVDTKGLQHLSQIVLSLKRQFKSDHQTRYPEDKYFIPRSHVVNPHNFHFLIRGATACRNSTPFLLIVVPSVYHHVSARQAIRSTWASVTKTSIWPDGSKLPKIALIFMFGTLPTVKTNAVLKHEAETYGDIIQEDFIDTYVNLTIKITGALRWVSKYCSGVRYVLKADEDVFINIPNLIAVLRDLPSAVLGRIESHSRALRYGRWNVRTEVYPFDYYPNYAQGNAYVIPGALVPLFYNASLYLPFLPIEDVFITGFLSLSTGTELENIPGFTFTLQAEPVFCNFSSGGLISKTNVMPSDMYLMWDILKSNSLCSEDERH